MKLQSLSLAIGVLTLVLTLCPQSPDAELGVRILAAPLASCTRHGYWGMVCLLVDQYLGKKGRNQSRPKENSLPASQQDLDLLGNVRSQYCQVLSRRCPSVSCLTQSEAAGAPRRL